MGMLEHAHAGYGMMHAARSLAWQSMPAGQHSQESATPVCLRLLASQQAACLQRGGAEAGDIDVEGPLKAVEGVVALGGGQQHVAEHRLVAAIGPYTGGARVEHDGDEEAS